MTIHRSLKIVAVGSMVGLALPIATGFLPYFASTIAPFATLNLVASASAKQPKGITYRPPEKLKPVIRTVGTGSRGCSQLANSIQITPLVPDTHMGQTLSKRPTFVASVKGTSTIEFTLIEPGVEKPLFVQSVKPDAQGFVRVELPETSPELTIGKAYRWSMAVVCNPNRRSNDVFAQSVIQRVAPPTELSQQLATATSAQEKARLYAESGFWYDAIATLTTAQQQEPQNAEVRNDFITLLSQVNLNQIVVNHSANTQAATLLPTQQ